MRALKILVVVMAVMLVAGVVVLIAAITARVSKPGATASFSAAPVEIPAGARVEAMTASGDRAVLDLVLTDGSRQLVVIDLASGRRLGTIPLRPAP